MDFMFRLPKDSYRNTGIVVFADRLSKMTHLVVVLDTMDGVVSAVFKTKLRPRFIGPFTVVAKKGLAYTLNLPRKLRTHPVFYVGLLKPYRDPSHVNLEALAPRKLALPSVAKSVSGCQAEPPSGLGPTPTPEYGLASRQTHSGSYPMSKGDHSAREAPSNASPSVYRPPPTLLDEQGHRQFDVERLLKRRHRQGQYQYLVKWRGYPESENS
ncbi:unnamed protein product [Hyaloperonospora brassicae]|uniref:Chromo domain-containing protein n=1 Tax=Hyaloperonospora brassicae TaxID=162125 RepID=A0AAV0T4F9_HYABA|nr:unnamed protein product [Hyaloperonospora brassicae]